MTDNELRALIGHAKAGMAQANEICKEAAAREQAVNDLIPDVINALVSNNRIREEQAVKCASYLRDPVMTLQLMQKLAAHNNSVADETHRMGQPASSLTTKSASAGQTLASDDAYFGPLLGQSNF